MLDGTGNERTPRDVRHADGVAEAIAFVVSDRARHITGEILNVAAAYTRN